VKLKNVKSGTTSELKADGVFVAIGHAPSVDFLGGQLRTKAGGYVVTEPDSTATGIAGVYAAGDVTDDFFRQAVTAAGQGCMAALEAEKFLAMSEEAAEAAE
jgi:thioredoxin reductase (NADPH)